MKQIKYIGFIAALAMLTMLVGCATFQQNAGKLLASTALTVDAAMKGWAQWVVAGQAKPEQEAAVKAAYVKYQASMSIAKNAYADLSLTDNRTAWEHAAGVLINNRTALVELITSFQSKP